MLPSRWSFRMFGSVWICFDLGITWADTVFGMRLLQSPESPESPWGVSRFDSKAQRSSTRHDERTRWQEERGQTLDKTSSDTVFSDIQRNSCIWQNECSFGILWVRHLEVSSLVLLIPPHTLMVYASNVRWIFGWIIVTDSNSSPNKTPKKTHRSRSYSHSTHPGTSSRQSRESCQSCKGSNV